MKIKTWQIWSAIWVLVFILDYIFHLSPSLENKGISVIEKQYYRFVTGLFLHANLFHLAVNLAGIYYTGTFLYGHISEIRLLIFVSVSAVITNALFSVLYPQCTSIGGSPVVFALIGVLFLLQLTNKQMPRLQMGTVHGSWILSYAVLGNIPVFSKNASTLVIHMLALGISMVFGYFIL